MFALLPSINSIRWIACHLSQPIIDVRIAKVAFPLTSGMTYWLLEEQGGGIQSHLSSLLCGKIAANGSNYDVTILVTPFMLLVLVFLAAIQQGISELTQKHLEGPAYEIVKVFHPDVVHLPVLKGRMPQYLLTDQVDDAILRITIWIEEECKYDVAAMYGISHWWFQRQRFYIDRHTSEGDRKGVRTHMRILSVVRIEVFSMYGYNYMKKIVLRRADLKEYVIAERDFKYLIP
ncbi:hypothetical protein Tco_0153397 [Tanacetum coccineum]